MAQITIQVSDELIEQLEPFRDRLPELLERGLQDVLGDAVPTKTVPTLESLRDRRDELLAIFDKHGAYDVQVFGSVARGEATAESDIDFLIQYDRDRTTPWFPGGLIVDLEECLDCKIDIAMSKSLRPVISESVYQDAVAL